MDPATTFSPILSPLSAQPSNTPRKSSASAIRTRSEPRRTGNGPPSGTITGAFRRGTPLRYRRPSADSVFVRWPPGRIDRIRPREHVTQATRRVVTGRDASGKAIVVIDGAASNVKLRKASGATSTLQWMTDESPADISGGADRAERDIGVAPPPSGSIFRIVDFPPSAEFEPVDSEALIREMGMERALRAPGPPATPPCTGPRASTTRW